MLTRSHLTVMAALAAGLLPVAANAQSAQPPHSASDAQPGARHGAMHRAGSAHSSGHHEATGAMHHGKGGMRHAEPASAETDRLNQQSLERSRQDSAAPAEPGMAAPNRAAPAR